MLPTGISSLKKKAKYEMGNGSNQTHFLATATEAQKSKRGNHFLGSGLRPTRKRKKICPSTVSIDEKG